VTTVTTVTTVTRSPASTRRCLHPLPDCGALLPVLATLVASQILLVTGVPYEKDQAVLSKVVGITDFNPGHFNEAVEALMHASLRVSLDVILLITLALYLGFGPSCLPFG
jgi:hypothetical protein